MHELALILDIFFPLRESTYLAVPGTVRTALVYLIGVRMIFKEKPADFDKRFDIVGCFLEHDGRFVLLHRHPHKANGGKWGLPAGKREEGEDIAAAVLREVKEETGLELRESAVHHFDSVYVRDGAFDIEWHMFFARVEGRPDIKVNPYEHAAFAWASPAEALEMNLIHDLAESIELFYKRE